jgi:tetratricopeptide (TPR) repeat protein
MAITTFVGCRARNLILVAALFGAAASARAQEVSASLSPAEQRIAAARKAIAAHPAVAQPYNDLALALSRRARETGDPAYYDRASEAIASALTIEPASLEAKKLQVWILLGKHQFARAYDAAVALNKQVPDDVLVYGFVADASVELGKYTEAEDAVQWMLDMRPANLSGLTRAAYLRELFGDIDGAIDLFNATYNRMAPTEVEDRAWILSQVGHLYLSIGQEREADAALQQALQLFPRYHYALGSLAQVRLAQGRPEEAVALLRQLCEALPHAENVYALAEALDRAGHTAEASRAYADFEQKALAESTTHDNANRELIAYYIDHAGRPRDALRVAELEYERRQDLFTRETYAWALAANRRYADAQKQMDLALAVGIRHAGIFYRAGVIAAELHDRPAAVRMLERSLQQAPRSPVANAARKQLDRLKSADPAP